MKSVEVSIDSQSGHSWYKYQNGSFGTPSASYNPFYSNWQGGTYATPITWPTPWSPLGNNGGHKITVDPVDLSHWGPDPNSPPDQPQPYLYTDTVSVEPVRARVVNCYVTNVTASNGSADYFKWDAEGTADLADPKITFTIKDADPHAYL